jgi:hypothetical protein
MKYIGISVTAPATPEKARTATVPVPNTLIHPWSSK